MALINEPDRINLTPDCADRYTTSALWAKVFCDMESLGPRVAQCATYPYDNSWATDFYECSGQPQAP